MRFDATLEPSERLAEAPRQLPLEHAKEQAGAGLRLECHQVGDPNSVIGENLDIDTLVERLGDETERPPGLNDGESPGTRLVPDDELLADGLLRNPDGAS